MDASSAATNVIFLVYYSSLSSSIFNDFKHNLEVMCKILTESLNPTP